MKNKELKTSLDAVCSALSDPTRRAILLQLIDGEATVGELTHPFQISQPAISRHLRVLEEAGLVARRVDGPRRPCRLVSEPLDELHDFVQQVRGARKTRRKKLDDLFAELRADESLETK